MWIVYRRELRTGHGIKMLHGVAATHKMHSGINQVQPTPKAIEAICVGERPLGRTCLDESLKQFMLGKDEVILSCQQEGCAATQDLSKHELCG